MSWIPLAEGIGLDAEEGALTGVLRDGGAALLINAVHRGLEERLCRMGIETVERVLLCHHRRDIADGLRGVLARWPAEVVVPREERELFESPERYWNDPNARWRLLCGHVPYHATHGSPVAVAGTVAGGDLMQWRGWRIRVLATPGPTDGSVSYLVDRGEGGPVWAFTGDLIWGPGRVRDLYSLQCGVVRNGHRVGDYHGFAGAMWRVLESLDHVLEAGPECLLPAHGVVMANPRQAVALLRSRFDAAYRAYADISALRWYFPRFFADHHAGATSLPLQETFEPPPNVRRLLGTTWALLADDGHALLLDPHSPAAVDAARAALHSGEVKGYDGIWLTHYHHDHVEGAAAARERFGIPVLTDAGMADVVSRPERYFLTCLSPLACPVDRATRDGETWRWRSMRLTAYHFPGQTLYHGGLHAVPDHGPTLFFAGDAVTPTGIDDYCTWNRNWLGPAVGYDRCLRLLRALAPDIVFNPHVAVGFRFSEDAYNLMLDNLRRRADLLRDLMPWEDPNLGLDESWVHTEPYEQTAKPGETARVTVCLRNHLTRWGAASVRALPPPGLAAEPVELAARCEPGREVYLVFALGVPSAAPAGRIVVPFDITFDGTAFGSLREAIVRVGPE
ncbi:MAG: MBL fold metallo-hydrolase [Lentisphaeria bacterium]|nr:MBL fold metallo-hydrolase [Lentisphaeria bacterium]